ncbi:MAG: nitrous oxide reductase family maturation protein NosD [Gemmobacter sp.]
MRRFVLAAAALFATLALVAAPIRAETSTRAAPGTLAAVLSDAAPGSVILLDPGDYGALAARALGGRPGAPLTLRAADSARPPRFAVMDLRDARHLILDGLVFDYRFAPGDPIHLRPFKIVGGTGITLRGLRFEGDDARGRAKGGNGSPTGFGLALTDVHGVTLESSDISGFFRGLVVERCSDIIVRGNLLHSLRMDGMNFAQVDRVLIEGNTVRDFRRLVDATDHADMIQFWTNKTTAPSRDIVIRGNLLNSGRGAYTQSIFMRNEEVDRGRAGPEMFYRNVLIEGNFVLNAHLHGITVGETQGLVIRGNTLVRNPASEGKKHNPSLWTPMIRVSPGAERVVIERNVVAKIAGYEGQAGWRVTDNLLVQDRSRAEAAHYSRVFVGGDARLPASFAPLPGGPLDGTGLGARIVMRGGSNSRALQTEATRP